jgi:hypothetical protein
MGIMGFRPGLGQTPPVVMSPEQIIPQQTLVGHLPVAMGM